MTNRRSWLQKMEDYYTRPVPTEVEKRLARSPDTALTNNRKYTTAGYLQSYSDDYNQEVRSEGFVNNTDYQFLSSYCIESLMELLAREGMNRFDGLMKRQKHIGRNGRAQMIDRLFLVATNVKIEDKQIVYQAASYMDRFYNSSRVPEHSQDDFCLTAYVGLFLASKNSEVEPLSLRDIRDHFLKGSFGRKEIIEREYQIRRICKYENEVSLLFDFMMTFVKIWKLGVIKALPEKQHIKSTYDFMCHVETVAYDFTKSLLVDAESLKYCQSLLISGIVSASLEIAIR